MQFNLAEKQLDQISKAVDLIVESFESGARLIYVGSGTSGKLAVIDANTNTIDEILNKCNYDPKIAIIVIETGLNVEEAKLMLEKYHGRVAKVLQNYNKH